MSRPETLKTIETGTRVARLFGGPVWTPEVCLSHGEVRIEGGCIAEFRAETNADTDGGVQLNVRGALIAPGLLDVHMHGAGGGDALYGEVEQVDLLRRSAMEGGAAGLVVVVPYFTDDPDLSRFRAAIEALQMSRATGARILGVHLETPFINPDKRGGFPLRCCHPPDVGLFRRLLEAGEGMIRVMTLAPELEGMEVILETALEAGVRVSLGHSAASVEVARRGFAMGADRLTHTFNAMDSLHHREIGLVGAAFLDDDVFLEVICDGIHLAPDTLLLLGRMFSARRLVGITDANAGAGMPEGTEVFPVGGRASVKNGAVRLEGGTLAGSVIRIGEGLQNLVRWSGLPPRAALECVTLTAARSVGLDTDHGSIEKGKRADLTILDAETLTPRAVILGGKLAWKRGSRFPSSAPSADSA